MNRGRTIFSQLMEFLPKREFRRCVEKHRGDSHIRSFSCWDQFLCMAFAQLTYRESLRDIESCLRAIGVKLYHLGIKGKVSRSTLADANNNRNSEIFAEFSRTIISQARELYCRDKFDVALQNVAYCLDASVIDLCLALCPWSRFDHTGRGGIKIHTLLDLRGNIPSFIAVTPRKTYETTILDQIPIEPGAFYIMDRGYFDWTRLFRIHTSKAFFVIRLRRGLSIRRLYSKQVNKEEGVVSDHICVASGGSKCRLAHRSSKKYPSKVRRIRYKTPDTGKYLIFLTNNFNLPARTIADLYRARWKVELFFKWIKQHLRIKQFYGTSINAITTQIHIAVTIYVLVAIVKKRLSLDHDLHTILQILSVTCFEKIPINSAFSLNNYIHEKSDPHIQQVLWEE